MFFIVLHQNVGFTKQNHIFACKSLVLFGFFKVLCYFGTESLVLLSKTIHLCANHSIYLAKLYILVKLSDLLSKAIHLYLNHAIYLAKQYISK